MNEGGQLLLVAACAVVVGCRLSGKQSGDCSSAFI